LLFNSLAKPRWFVALGTGRLPYSQQENIWKEAVLEYFRVLSGHSRGSFVRIAGNSAEIGMDYLSNTRLE
jgi:hypothetical protein